MTYLTRCYHCGNKINVGDEQFKCPKAEFTQLLLAKVAGITLSKLKTGNLNSSDQKAIATAALKIAECELCYINRAEESQLLNYDMIVEI